MRSITEKKFKEVFPNCYQQILNLKLDMSNLNIAIYEIFSRSGIVIITVEYNNNDVFKGYNGKVRVNTKNIFNTSSYETPVIIFKDGDNAQKHASLFALNLLEVHLAYSG